MNKIAMWAIGMAAIIAFSGCASQLMKPVTKGPADYQPGPGEVTVIFLRNSFFGSAIQASVFDVTTEETEFIGIVSNKYKVAYKTTPGKHMFMVISENGDFMSGDFEAGKTYYALVTPRMGAWKARFSLKPVHKGDFDDKFASHLRATKFVENTPESIAWAEQNGPDIIAKREKDLPRWLQKAERDKIGLLPEDGQ